MCYVVSVRRRVIVPGCLNYRRGFSELICQEVYAHRSCDRANEYHKCEIPRSAVHGEYGLVKDSLFVHKQPGDEGAEICRRVNNDGG